MLVGERCEAAKVFLGDGVSGGLEVVDGVVHVGGVPEHEGVEREAERAEPVFLAVAVGLAELAFVAVEESVQNWPACERSRDDVTAAPPSGLPLPQMRPLTLRGVPAIYFGEDRRLELYTGRTTVVLFGSNLASLRRAASKLRTRSGGHPRVEPGELLPCPVPGALEGRLRSARGA